MKNFGLGIILIIAVFQLMGCSHVMNREATLAQWRKEVIDTLPTCTDCAMKWDLSQQWVREHCKTGIKQVSDSLIETNPSEGYSRTCIVRKRPTADGQYTIDLELLCRFSEACMESNVLTTRKTFNQYVNKGNADSEIKPTIEAVQQVATPPEQPKDIVASPKSASNEPPENIKKEIKKKCTSDFPSDYVQQASCVKAQEAGWIELNR